MTPYVYTPLDEEANEIRLMTLLPALQSSEIRVELENSTLTEDDQPQYEALSYVWGSAENLVDIQVGHSNETLVVTQNLATALSYLRYEDRPRRLWIDAICVDQQNLSERSQQVLRMGDVYQLAERVVVWLGTEDKTSGFAMDTLRNLSSEIQVDWQLYEVKPAPHRDPDWGDEDVTLPYDLETLDAIYDLLNRPWFERLWVQQEARLAKSSAVVMCGFDTILWQQLCDAAFCIRMKRTLKLHAGLDQRLALVFLFKRKIYRLVNLMQEMRRCKCSDPRDKVYALLILAVDVAGNIDVKPDYTKTVSEVYQQFVLQFVDHFQDLTILSHCELRERLTDMPSWVPDWSVPVETPVVFGGYLASGLSACKIQKHAGKGILKAAGVRCATINKVEHISMRSNTGNAITTVRRLTPPEALNMSNSYVGGGSLFDAYCRTFCRDNFADRYEPPRSGNPDFQKSKEAFRNILEHRAGFLRDRSLLNSRCWDYVYGSCQGRSLITTKEGYIGLAPKTTKAGDVVCVLLGCDIPLVFRPTENGQYKVVGDCYICGLMDGEALLGPFPDHFEFVWRLKEEFGYRAAYLDRETGETQIDDPRLGPLPAGWRKKSHIGERAYNLFVEDIDSVDPNWESDTTGTRNDPRLTAEALTERNVKLIVFELV